MENFTIGAGGGGAAKDKKSLPDDDITMTHTGIFTRNKQKVVHVIFERKTAGKKAFAEAVIPSCTFLGNEGFAEEEIEALKVYLNMNKEEIFAAARQVNHDVFFKL